MDVRFQRRAPSQLRVRLRQPAWRLEQIFRRGPARNDRDPVADRATARTALSRVGGPARHRGNRAQVRFSRARLSTGALASRRGHQPLGGAAARRVPPRGQAAPRLVDDLRHGFASLRLGLHRPSRCERSQLRRSFCCRTTFQLAYASAVAAVAWVL